MDLLDRVWPDNPADYLTLTDFSRHVLGHKNLSSMHLEWDKKLEEMFNGLKTNEGPKWGLILAPFQHGKSVRVGVNYPLWALLKNHELRILNVGAVETQSSRQVGTVFGYINDQFPWMKTKDPDEHWGLTEFTVERKGHYQESSYTAMGLFGSGITGGHWDIIIADDLCTQANTRTPYQRAQTSDWFRMTLLGRLTPGGVIIVIGSRWHPQDFYKQILELKELMEKFKGEKGFTLVHKAILDFQTHELVWPQKNPDDGGYSWNRIMDLWTVMGSVIASLQMQNDPMPTEGNMLKAEWLNQFSIKELPSPDKIRYAVIPVDPAFSTAEPGDWCAASCLVKDRNKQIYLVEARHWHEVWTDFAQNELEDFWHEMKALVERKSESRIIWHMLVEVNNFGNKKEFNKQMNLLKELGHMKDIPIIGVHTSIDKETRFGTRAAFYENGSILVREDLATPGNPFHDEWVAFPTGDHDDLIDCVDIGLQRLLPIRTPRASRSTSRARTYERHVRRR